MLASASHELRTPLARIRMATELLAGQERPELTAQIAADVAELDGLIEELLLASRLQTSERVAEAEPIDLLALVAEEGARVNAAVSGRARDSERQPATPPPLGAQPLRERPPPRGRDRDAGPGGARRSAC